MTQSLHFFLSPSFFIRGRERRILMKNKVPKRCWHLNSQIFSWVSTSILNYYMFLSLSALVISTPGAESNSAKGQFGIHGKKREDAFWTEVNVFKNSPLLIHLSWIALLLLVDSIQSRRKYYCFPKKRINYGAIYIFSIAPCKAVAILDKIIIR